jgi:hypothetical protein
MARVFLNNETYSAASDDAEINGSAGTEQVNVFAGVTGLDVKSSVERVDLPGEIADFTFSSFGNSVTILDGDGNVVAAVSGADGKQLVFGDGSVDVAYDGTTLTVGGETVGGTAAAITPAASEIDTATTSESPGADTDEDDAPTFSVSDNGPVEEGNTATFTVNLSASQGTATTVDYAVGLEGGATAADHGAITAGGTAGAGATGTLTFAAGETSKTIEIPVEQDLESPETGEGLSVTLSNPSGDVELDSASTTAAITDVDPFTLTQGVAEVEEGDQVTYTLTTDVAVTEATDVSFAVEPGDASAADQGTSDTNLNDFSQGAFNPSTVTIAAGDNEATFTLTTEGDNITELPEDYDVVATIDGDEVGRITTTLLDGSNQSLTTTNGDTLQGTPEDDTFTGAIGTLQANDIIEGLGGTGDTLDVRVANAIGAPTLLGIENYEFETVGSATSIDLSSSGGFTSVLVEGTQDFEFGNGDTLNALPSYTLMDYGSTLTLSHADDALGDQDDDAAILDFTLNNVSDATIQIDLDTGTGADEIIDNLSIASDGSSANSVTLGFENTIDDVNNYSVTGDQDLTLTTAVGNVSGGETVDGSGHNGVLTLDLTATTGTTVDFDNFSGVDALIADATGGTFDVDNAPDALGLTLTGDAPTTVSVNIPGAALPGTSNSLDVTLDNATDETDVDVTTLTANGVETINLTSNGGLQDGSEVNSIGSLANTNLTSLTITGDTDTDITTGDVGKEFGVDASGLTDDASLTFDANANTGGGVSVTGTGSADNITGSAQDDVIDAGAGDDANVDAGVGQDIVTLGAGEDTYIHVTGDSLIVTNNFTDSGAGFGDTPAEDETLIETDVITDFATGTNGDTFTFGNANIQADAGTVGQLEDEEYLLVSGQYDEGTQTFTVGDGTTDDDTNGDTLVFFDGDGANAIAATDVEAVVLQDVDIVGTNAVSDTLTGQDLTFG